MFSKYSAIIKRLADLYEQNYYEPYFDRWEETPFHHPADYEPYDISPEGVPTQILDIGDKAQEELEQSMIKKNKRKKKKPDWIS